MGDLHDDLRTELAAIEYTGNFAVLVVRAAIDFVGDQHRSIVFQPPYRANVRELARFRRNVLGINLLGPFGQFDLVRALETAASDLWFLLVFVFAPSLLSLFLRPHGEWFIDLCRWRAAGFLLEFR